MQAAKNSRQTQSKARRRSMVLGEWVDNIPVRTCCLLLPPSRYSELVAALSTGDLSLRGALEDAGVVTMTAPGPAATLANHLRRLMAASDDNGVDDCIAVDTACSRLHEVSTVTQVFGSVLIPDKSDPHTEFKILFVTAQPRPHEKVDGPFDGRCTACIVQRRYADFVTLRETLQPAAKHAGLVVPRLPPKTWSRRLGEAAVQRRQVALQRWLTWVMAHDVLWCAQLCLFLGIRCLRSAPAASKGEHCAENTTNTLVSAATWHTLRDSPIGSIWPTEADDGAPQEALGNERHDDGSSEDGYVTAIEDDP